MPSKKYVDLKNPVPSCSTAYQTVDFLDFLSSPCSNYLHVSSVRKSCAELYSEKAKNYYNNDQLLRSASLQSHCNLSCTANHFTAPRVLPRFCKRSLSPLVLYWHVISVLTCLMVTGYTVSASITSDMLHSNNITLFSTSSSSVYQNPLLRHLKSKNVIQPVCFVWTSKAPRDLCKETPRVRLRRLKEMFVFNKDCEGPNNINIAQLFKVQELVSVTPRSEFLKRLKHLKESGEGRDCIVASERAVCERCFKKLDVALQNVDKAYSKLNSTLQRFDCMRAKDTATTTRPFSSIGSCYACKIWYRYWLLVNSLNLLNEPPCMDWCDYAQRACPYLTPTKSVEFAGHPSFQCRGLQTFRDMKNVNVFDLGFFNSEDKLKCDCFHPCDLFENVLTVPQRLKEVEMHFFSPKRCRERQRQCASKKLHLKYSQPNSELSRYVKGGRSTFSMLSSDSSSKNRTVSRIRLQMSKEHPLFESLASSHLHKSSALYEFLDIWFN
uniref:DUF4773 domain-containing protein n=1 Tax=Syphacia muris TaxID=451379 RepID=A0A0N5AXA5_9BILA